MATRLLISLMTATFVSVTAFVCGWLQYRSYEYSANPQAHTRRLLERLRKELDRYHLANKKYPADLGELELVKNQGVFVNERGRVVDVWGTPIQYRVEGERFELV